MRYKYSIWKYKTLAEAVERMLDGSECYQGCLEDAAQTAGNCAEVLANLIVTLHEQGILSLDQISGLRRGRGITEVAEDV